MGCRVIFGGWSRAELFSVSDEAEDGADFVSGRAILLLCGDLGEIGEMIDVAHGDGTVENALEGGVAVEDSDVLCVDVEEIEAAGVRCVYLCDAGEEAAE